MDAHDPKTLDRLKRVRIGMVMEPIAYLAGTVRQPEAWLFFEVSAKHAAHGMPLREWVKLAPSRRWNPQARCWVVTAFGDKNPDAVLARAGFRIVIDQAPPGWEGPRDPGFDTAIGLADFRIPMAKQSDVNAGIALVRPRFAGWELTREILGEGARWDREMGRFEAPLTSVLRHGDPKRGLLVDRRTVEAARAALSVRRSFGSTEHSDDHLHAAAAKAALSTGLRIDEQIEDLIGVVGDVPDWFGMDQFPYQRVGSVAVAAGRSFLADPTGLGKGSPTWVRILTPDGWTTYGQVKVGDQVVGSDGRPVTVNGVYPRGELPVYRVEFSDGASVVVDGDHLWTVELATGKSVTWETRKVAEYVSRDYRLTKPRVPVVAPVEFTVEAALNHADPSAAPDGHDPLPLHPYLLGVLLARGVIQPSSVTLSLREPEVVERFKAALPRHAALVDTGERERQHTRYRVVSAAGAANTVARACRSLGLTRLRRADRFIPGEYLWAPLRVRQTLMAGLLDAAGRVTARGVIEFETVSAHFAADLTFLARSLGHVVTTATYAQEGKLLESGTFQKQNDRIRIRLSPPTVPAADPSAGTGAGIGADPGAGTGAGAGAGSSTKKGRRKAAEPVRATPGTAFSEGDERNAKVKAQSRRTIVAVHEAGVAEVVCISVDAADQLYVTEDFVVTHNTSQAIAALAIRDARRAVVIVPPVVVTHWAAEIERCGLAFPAPKPLSKAALKRAQKEAQKRGETAEAGAQPRRSGSAPASVPGSGDGVQAPPSSPIARSADTAEAVGHAPDYRSEHSVTRLVSHPVTDAPDGGPNGAENGETAGARSGPVPPPGPLTGSLSGPLSALPSGPGRLPRELAIFRAGRKEPELPDVGVVVVPDSLLTSRPELRRKLMAWAPDGLIYDEVHRARTWNAARATAARELATSMGPAALRVAATATPLFSNPSELASPLAISGHLDPVFGGYETFIGRYCKRDRFNALVPNPVHLPELRRLLAEHVWVRRRKDEVLPDLPKLFVANRVIDVDLDGFRAAHAEVIDTITAWVEAHLAENDGAYPGEDTIEAYARSQIGLMSPLRKAAGLAKVPMTIDLINGWIDSEVELNADGSFACTRPLLVWAHHKEVVDALRQQIRDLPRAHRPLVAVIAGETSAERRGQIVEAFQAGQVPILVCSITAAGVGITLTYGSDQLFVESDYSPPHVSQAIDRQNRIGQTRPVTVTTLIAEGTLDARIQEILARKSETIAEVQGDRQGLVDVAAIEGGGASPAEIITGLVNVAIDRHRRGHRRAA